jgi:hypothetical protein
MNVTPDVETARQEIGKTAHKMGDGSLSFLEGARLIHKLYARAKLLDHDPDIIVFTGIVSETDSLPIGNERQRWSAEALVRLQPEIDRAERWAQEFGRLSCERLIRRFVAAR